MIGMVLQLFGGRGASYGQMRENWKWGASAFFEWDDAGLQAHGLGAGWRNDFARDMVAAYNDILKNKEGNMTIKYVWKNGQQTLQVSRGAYERIQQVVRNYMDRIVVDNPDPTVEEMISIIKGSPFSLSAGERKDVQMYEGGNVRKLGISYKHKSDAGNALAEINNQLHIGGDDAWNNADAAQHIADTWDDLMRRRYVSYSERWGSEAYNATVNDMTSKLVSGYAYGRRSSTPTTDAYREYAELRQQQHQTRSAAAKKGWETRRRNMPDEAPQPRENESWRSWARRLRNYRKRKGEQ